MNGEAVIQARELVKQFPGNSFRSVDNVSLTIPLNCKFGVFGPNGAGKTTLMSMLCGLIPSDSGEVTYAAGQSPDIRSEIGYVPQDFAFYPELSAVENLRYFGALYRMSRVEIRERSEKLLHVLGLKEAENRPVNTYSGGMKRRINLAIGLLHEPEIVFLDEPTVGVDVQSRHAIIEFLESQHRMGKTIIYTSHHLAEAEAFCDQILLLDQGKIVAAGKTDELLQAHNARDLEEMFLGVTGKSYRDA